MTVNDTTSMCIYRCYTCVCVCVIAVESRGASRVVLVSAPFASPALRELAFHARPVPTGPAAAALTSPDPSGPPGTWGVAPDYR